MRKIAQCCKCGETLRRQDGSPMLVADVSAKEANGLICAKCKKVLTGEMASRNNR